MARSENIEWEGIAAFTGDLFVARKNEDSGVSKYGFSLLWAKSIDFKPLQEIAVNVAVAEWGEKAKQMIADGIIKSPFLDGDGPQGVSKKSGERHKGFAGHRFLRCTSGADYRPQVVDRKVLPVVSVEGIPSGSRVKAVLNAFTWENPKNGKGITFGVSMIQVVKKAEGDEVLGGGGAPDPKSHFEKLADEGEAPASTKDGKGASGLFG